MPAFIKVLIRKWLTSGQGPGPGESEETGEVGNREDPFPRSLSKISHAGGGGTAPSKTQFPEMESRDPKPWVGAGERGFPRRRPSGLRTAESRLQGERLICPGYLGTVEFDFPPLPGHYPQPQKQSPQGETKSHGMTVALLKGSSPRASPWLIPVLKVSGREEGSGR